MRIELMSTQEPQTEFPNFTPTAEQALDEALTRVYTRYNGNLKSFFDEIDRSRSHSAQSEPAIESGLLIDRLHAF